MEVLKIIDLSHYNTVTGLSEAVEGCDGVILRVGYRGYTAGNIKKDKKFEQYSRQLIELKVNWGVYFVTQAIQVQEAVEEAVFCIGQVMDLDRSHMTLGIWLDSEYANTKHTGRADQIGKELRTACANAFCEKLILSGYPRTGIYCSESWAVTQLLSEKINYPYWIAKYGSNDGRPQKIPSVPHIMWQYTSKGRLPGIGGSVDISYYCRQDSWIPPMNDRS